MFSLQWIEGERVADEVLSRIADGSATPGELGGAYARIDTDAGRMAFFRRVQKALESRVSV
jgi:hypothetical protein